MHPRILSAFVDELAKIADVKTPLLPHQERVVSRISAKDQPGLVVAHGLGSGKTLTSIAAQEALGMKGTVVTPAALQANYAKERTKHLVGKTQKADMASLENVARKGTAPANPLLIVDEAHRLREPSSKGTKAVRELEAQKRLLLTASPFYNHPADIAPLVNIAAGSKQLPEDRTGFEHAYLEHETVSPGILQRLSGVKPGTRARLAEGKKGALQKVLGKYVDYHPSSTENFPRVVREDVPVEMTKKQLQVYESLMGEAPFWVRSKVLAGLPPSKQESKQLNAFLSAARQATNTTRPFHKDPDQAPEEPKIQRAFEELQKTLDANPRARGVVYSNYLDAGVTPYRERLEKAKIPFGEFTGEMPKAKRDQLVRDYNEGKLRALLISSAGGEGLDLKGTRLMQVLDPHWNTEKIRQVEGRGVRYKSHEHLPEEEREVRIQRYLATRPRSGILESLRLKKPGKSTDEYLAQLAGDKDRINDEFRALLAAPHKTASADDGVATKTDPALWERMKARATAKMGGKHSARAMQLATKLYQDAGGDYAGKKPAAASNKMVKWTKQDWQTRPGTPEEAERPDGRTARYLPKRKWESLSEDEQQATDRKKLDAKEQFVDNTRAARVRGDAKYHG